jgi:hypothetical protein
VAHYYHLCAEIFMGLWRTYSALDPGIHPDGFTTLPPPSRLIFPHLGCGQWRDRADMNHLIIRAAFPSIAIETSEDWADRASTNRPYIMDTVVLTERSAVHRAKEFPVQNKMLAIADLLPRTPYWWAPVRANVLGFAKIGTTATSKPESEGPVITYVSRQGRGRSLNPESHSRLVDALKGLEKTYGWEVNVLLMESLSKAEQIQLAARTTVS